MSSNKHENYELLNLIGYGLSKFDNKFIESFGYKTKQSFYESLVKKGIAETPSTIKNRQDLFDPFFDNERKGWWQKGDAYIHRKIFIDSLFGEMDVESYSNVVKLYIEEKLGTGEQLEDVKPILKSKFKQLQITGQEAEMYFIHNYKTIEQFRDGVLEDARLLGDGYDFQVQVDSHYYLAEIKGVRSNYGGIRLTENEFKKADEYQEDYVLAVISNLYEIPQITTIFNPINSLSFQKQVLSQQQITYNSKKMNW